MTLQDQMQQVLDRTPDLDLVAFGDLTSGLILNWTARTRHPREVLDRLGERAATCLALLGPQGPAVSAAPFAATMIHFTETATQIFTRLEPDAEDVVCAVCSPGAALAPLVHTVTELAFRIDGAT
jgi:hypothetical protein